MGKKSKSFEESEERLTKAVRDSAQEIWKAGLGAFTDLQKRARAVEGDRAGHVRETVDTLEKVFEERVTRALHAIGVPMRQDINALIERVEQLSRQVEELQAAAKKPVKKATAKKA
ncbi:phasin family protein [Pseudoduganella sp.]|uniref:phasin family protein n=1 Tax=Pseudoduganella sp. TaxID=1880898 RepID=UPI0035B1A641